MNDARLHLLIEKHLEGTLTEEEARELVEAPEATLLDEVLMASLLERAHGQAADLAPRVQAALRAGREKDALAHRIMDGLPAATPQRRHGWLAGIAIAASLLIVAIVGSIVGRTSVPRSIEETRHLGPAGAQAVRKAVDYIRAATMPPATHAAPMPPDGLILLALSHAGISKEDPFFAKLLEGLLSAKLQRTYNVSIQAVLLQKLDPVLYRNRIAACARFLIENQCVNGQWSYGKETAGPSPSLDGNNSCSLFAALGLRACHDAGVAIPREALDRAARWWRECRRPYPDVGDGEVAGWCYTREETPHRPYGSMTAGAVAALIIEDSLLGEDWRKDAVVQAGLRWLAKYFSVSENFGPVEDLMAREMVSDTPNPRTEVYYYLWALERAAGVAGLEKLGEHEWYAEGAYEIIAQQRPDGSWFGGAKRCQPVYDTCYAILFLARPTRPMDR